VLFCDRVLVAFPLKKLGQTITNTQVRPPSA
jgi:hypothetical protein